MAAFQQPWFCEHPFGVFYGCLVCAGLMLVIPWRKRNIKELTASIC